MDLLALQFAKKNGNFEIFRILPHKVFKRSYYRTPGAVLSIIFYALHKLQFVVLQSFRELECLNDISQRLWETHTNRVSFFITTMTL